MRNCTSQQPAKQRVGLIGQCGDSINKKRQMKALVREKQKGNRIAIAISIVFILWFVMIGVSVLVLENYRLTLIVLFVGVPIIIIVRAWHNTTLLRSRPE